MKPLIHILLLIIMLALGITASLAQSIGDYKSVGTGNWTSLATWQRYNGTTYYSSGNPKLTVLTDQGGYNVVTTSISPASVCESGSFILSATVVPSLGATIKWYTVPGGGDSISTGSPYNTGNITTTTTYYVEAQYTGDTTYTTSRTAVVAIVNKAPVITTQPVSQAICLGTPITFSVTATGTPTPTYKWRKGITPIPGANFSSYTISSVSASDTTWYNVLITNSCGEITSHNIHLTLNLAPSITAQPIAPAATCSGNGTQMMSVTATGTGLTYSWRRGGVAVTNGGIISGQGTATLTLTNPTTADAGNYNVVVDGTCLPSVTSNPVMVTVNPFPLITSQPTDQLECEGNVVSFNVGTSGSGLSYTWQRKNPSEGSFADILSEPNVSYSAFGTIRLQNVGNSDAPSGTQYRVLISNANCSVTSNPAILTVNEITDVIPSVSYPFKTGVIICTGSNFSYQVTTSQPSNIVSCLWKKKIAAGPWTDVANGGVISGATSSQLTFTGVTPSESGEYKVTVEFNKTGSTTCMVTSDSRKRKLTVNPLAEVTPGGPDNTCQSVTPSAITLSGGGGGASTGAWSITNLNPANGGVNGALSTIEQIASPETVTYTPPANYSGIITLTLTTDDPAGPCGAVSATRTFTVNPLPNPSLIYHN